jgi:hypothetical protein
MRRSRIVADTVVGMATLRVTPTLRSAVGRNGAAATIARAARRGAGTKSMTTVAAVDAGMAAG